MNDMQVETLTTASLAEAIRALTAEGAALPSERALALRFHVSRHQLRRAMALMREEGALPAPRPAGRTPRRRGESRVGSTSPLEVIELRLMLEPSLAEYAALRASPQEVARIERAAHTAPGIDTGLADIAFHNAIAAAAHNVLATDVYTLLREVGTDARLRVMHAQPLTPGQLERRDSEHRIIAAAIASRNPIAAEAAMRDHLLSVEKQVRNRLPREPAGV